MTRCEIRRSELGDLPEAIRAAPAPRSVERVLTAEEQSLATHIREELRKHSGNVTAVARSMGKSPTQVHRWLKRLGVDPAEFRV